MSNPKLSTETDQLRKLALTGDAAAFAKQLFPLLQDDFARVFQEVKIQKLISQFRSKSHIKTVRDALLNLQSTKEAFSKNEIDALAHHFDICEFFQDLYDYIDAETVAQSCHVAHPEVFLRTVVRVLEIVNYGFQKNITANVIAERGVTALQLSQSARQFRDLLDAGNVILGAKISRNGKQRDYKISDAEIGRLFDLAFQYDEVRQIFDIYTYQEADFRLNRRSLIVKKNSLDAERASAVGAERTSDFDHTRYTLLGTMEANVERECRNIQAHSTLKFFDYLLNLGQEAQVRSREYFRAFWADLEYEVRGYFDLTSSVTTKCGTFTISELAGAWACISTIAMLGQRWSERLAVVTNSTNGPRHSDGRRIVLDVPTPELGRNWVIRMLARETNVSREQARALIHQFSSEPTVGRTDMFYRPLLSISDMILFPTAYIRSSRFDRNVFMLIATESDLDQKRKGYLPVVNLRTDFVEAEFQALTDFKVRVNGEEVTDLDLAAFKDGTLFVAQSKIVIEPDSSFDTWKAEQKLRRAAVQLDKCLERLDAIRDGLFERLGLKGSREKRVVPFIMTNSRLFTERRFGGYPVVDLPYLRFVLGGARGAIIGTGSGTIRTASGKAYIKGKYPTAQEFEELLNRTIHKVRDREMVERYEMKKIGDRKIHIPMVGLKTSGHGRMVLTDKETFHKYYDQEPVRTRDRVRQPLD